MSEEEKPYSVGGYLDLINKNLLEFKARVQGEVTELKIYQRFLFFSLKDKEGKSLLNCFMGKRDYLLCGIDLEDGLEIVAEGYPKVYKPNGQLRLQTSVIELVGEGALKKAYDKLYKKLAEEGLFAPERKRPLPSFPQSIGVITSASGRVIKDFITNLDRHGFKIKMIDSRVEGQSAVPELLAAIDQLKNSGLDALVIIRGGGSLESLQAFNNETLVRAVAAFDAPVICGIGHEEDVPLASLAADFGVSTPTAAAVLLNAPWKQLSTNLDLLEREIINGYQRMLAKEAHRFESLSQRLILKADFASRKFKELTIRLENKIRNLERSIVETKRTLHRLTEAVSSAWKKEHERLVIHLDGIEKRIKSADPKRQLSLGYSITFFDGLVVKSVDQVVLGGSLNVRVADGRIDSKIESIEKDAEEVAGGAE